MNILTKIRSAGTFLKAAVIPSNLRFPGGAFVNFGFQRATESEMRKAVGNGTTSDVLMTPVRWLQRSIVEAPIVAQDEKGDPIENSELVDLLKAPNPFYSGEVLLAGTVMSLALDGNAYWIVNHGRGGEKIPATLHYVPHTDIEPDWPADDPKKFITHYLYKPKGQPQKLRPFGLDANDARAGVPGDVVDGLSVIHFREGIDPDNLRKGLSPLGGLLREIWTDDNASAFTAALLRNNGIPGVVFSPADNEVTFTEKEAKAIEAKVESKFTGEGRGRVLINRGATKVEQFGFSPEQMDLSALRNVSEERVTAALGVHAAVVGFGAGLQSTKVGATMESMVRQSWSRGVIPLQKLIAGEISRTLAPVFDAASVEFDNKGVQALRENEDLKAGRIGRLYRDGVITRSDARGALNFDTTPADDVYVSNLATTFIPQGQTAPPSNGNGADPKGHGFTIKKVDGVPLVIDDSTGLAMYRAEVGDHIKRPNPQMPQCISCFNGAPCPLHDPLEPKEYWRALAAAGRRSKEAPPAEQRIIAAAPSAEPLPITQRMADELNAIRLRAPAILQARLERAFGEFGDAVELAARRVLDDFEMVSDSSTSEQKSEEWLADPANNVNESLFRLAARQALGELPEVDKPDRLAWILGSRKAIALKQDQLTPADISLAADLFTEIDIEAAKRAIQEAFEQGFLEISIEVSGSVGSTFGIEFELTDQAQQRVLQEAGLRSGLIDLDAQTRDALFDALAEGRAEGLAGDNLARRIREHIEAGPWRDVETRARVIARTEGAHAANVSTLEAARAMPDTEHVQVFDDRRGDGDAQCSAANGKIVTIQEAEAMGLCHPNGTRSYVPVNALLLEEMGL